MRPASSNQPKQRVLSLPGVCGGKPCVAGTRVRVWDVAVRAQGGESPDEILASFPHLTLSDVHAALAHFYDNRAEIEKDALEDERLAEHLHGQHGAGPLEEKCGNVPSAPTKSEK